MFIYVVKTGESIFSIARKYQVTMDSIRTINGLSTDTIVPGQDLLIPTDQYVVQPGDSLFTISQMAMVSADRIKAYNGLQSNELSVGQTLYLPPREKYSAYSFGYITVSTPESNQLITQTYAPLNTYYGIFEHHVLADGSLSELNDQGIVNMSRDNFVAPIAVVTNLTSTGFDPNLTVTILSNATVRQRLITNIYNLLRNKNYSGVNIDFEQIPASQRDNFTAFLRELRTRIQPGGFSLSVALPFKTEENDPPWRRGYDYRGIGAAVDFVFLMAYDWHELGSDPGPVAPIQEVRKTVNYAIQTIGARKILLGVPRYGYDWTVANGQVVSAKAVSVAEAIKTAMRHNVPISYSREYQQPFFTYWDATGAEHRVWFEDARALAQKLQMIVDKRLRGIGSWHLGLPFTQSAVLFNEFFRIRRIL
ncbi:glycosyl hydrolase family 18 protein [Rummeliibacillus stabekisii]|uniref:glycosyl hydrolase family 18 protein n=1 Tax=Rummeliibacillus stabekisii TaxID=241244 RepID=UPI0037172120